jgi:hypothetical protein
MSRPVPQRGVVRKINMNSAAMKKYKVDISKRSSVTLPKEKQIIEDTVVVLKVAHYSNTQIAKIVGLSRGQVAEILKDTRIQRRVEQIAEKLPQAALNQLQNYMIEAVQWVVHVGRSNLGPDGDHNLVLKAADTILDRGGTPKTSRTERKDENENPLDAIGRGGHEGVFERVRLLPPESQERAAQLYDALEDGLKLIIEESVGEAEAKDADETP